LIITLLFNSQFLFVYWYAFYIPKQHRLRKVIKVKHLITNFLYNINFPCYNVILLFLCWVSVYLAEGMNSVSTFTLTGATEYLRSAPLSCFVLANSVAKASCSSITTTLIIGLSYGFGETQAIAISTAFHAEFMSKFPSKLESTMALISPFDIMELTRSLMWPGSSFSAITAWFVIISKRTTPKL